MYLEERKRQGSSARALRPIGRAASLALLAVLGVALCSGAFAGDSDDRTSGVLWGGPPTNDEDDDPLGRWRKARGSDLRELSGNELEGLRALQSLGYLSGSSPMPNETGVVYYEPEHTQPGLNFFTSGHFPGAVLMDMEGNVLHTWEYDFLSAWPHQQEYADAEGTEYWRWAHLFENGDVLAIFEGLGLIKVDKDSRLLWEHWGGEHHDLEVTESGDIYVLTRQAHVVPEIHHLPILEDFVTILDADGHVVREVSILDAFRNSPFSGTPEARDRPKRGDIYHTNAIEVLDGRLEDRIPAFREGNVLLSMRQLSTIAVLDMTTEQIVWVSSGLWLEQHDPKVLDNGNILVFDNKGDDGKSKIVEFDPVTLEMEWVYCGTDDRVFFTKMCGASHRLPNGNTLVSESDFGRAFEVTPDGFIVWEFLNPNRAGEDNELIATLFDVVRLPEDFPTDWLDR